MKSRTLIVLLLFVGTESYAQYFDHKSDSFNFQKAVEHFFNHSLVQQNFNTKELMFCFLPDFSLGIGGSVTTVEIDNSGCYYLKEYKYTFCSLYFSKVKKVRIDSIQITHDFTNIIIMFYENIINYLNAANYNSNEIRLDGTTYYFLISDMSCENKIGSIWSPNKGEVINDIIDLTYKLFKSTKRRNGKLYVGKKMSYYIDKINRKN